MVSPTGLNRGAFSHEVMDHAEAMNSPAYQTFLKCLSQKINTALAISQCTQTFSHFFLALALERPSTVILSEA